MDAGLSQIGTHCFLSTCKELDFLPIQCDGCQHHFCRHHIVPDTHQCEDERSNVKSQENIENNVAMNTKRCSARDCGNPSLDAYNSTAAICNRCSGSYCAYHRYPESHGCSEQPTGKQATSKTQAARAILQRKFPFTKSTQHVPSARAKPPSNPTRLAQYRKAEVIKMRHRAVPGDPKDQAASVPLQERLHVNVSVAENERIFWFRKTLIAGRVLDQLAMVLNQPSVTQLAYLKGDEYITIRNDCILADQVEDGCTLVLIP